MSPEKLREAIAHFANMASHAKRMNDPYKDLALRFDALGQWKEVAPIFESILVRTEAMMEEMQRLHDVLEEARQENLPDYMKGGEPIWK